MNKTATAPTQGPELSKSCVLANLFTSSEIDEVLQKINPAYIRDDVRQHAFLVLFEKDEAFIIDLHTRGKLRQYVAKTIYNTANFSESKFNREYRRHTEIPTESFQCVPDEETDYDYEALVESCNVKLEAIYWYNRDLLRLYVKLGSYRKVSEETGIPVNSVHHAVKQAKEEMRRLLWE
jgi:DNA-directed RNA polymerase specialized sigma24 family protein